MERASDTYMCAFSGKDQMLPSADEAKRLRKILPKCRTRYFKDSGHSLLLVRKFSLILISSCIMQVSRVSLFFQTQYFRRAWRFVTFQRIVASAGRWT